MPTPEFVAVTNVTPAKIEQDDGSGTMITIGYRVTAVLTPEPGAYIDSADLYRQLFDRATPPSPKGAEELVDVMYEVGFSAPANYAYEGNDWAWIDPPPGQDWWYKVKVWSYKYMQTEGKHIAN